VFFVLGNQSEGNSVAPKRPRMGLVWGAVRFGLTTLWLGCVITMMGLWWYNKFQHTQQSKVEISNGSKSTDKGSDSCSTKNIDIFIVTERRSFPLVEWTVRSIELFMPCRGRMHIVCEPGETTMLLGFVGRVKDLSIHEMERPKSLMNASAYHMMQWPQFWADKYVSPTADYVMFMVASCDLSVPLCTKWKDLLACLERLVDTILAIVHGSSGEGMQAHLHELLPFPFPGAIFRPSSRTHGPKQAGNQLQRGYFGVGSNGTITPLRPRLPGSLVAVCDHGQLSRILSPSCGGGGCMLSCLEMGKESPSGVQ